MNYSEGTSTGNSTNQQSRVSSLAIIVENLVYVNITIHYRKESCAYGKLVNAGLLYIILFCCGILSITTYLEALFQAAIPTIEYLAV